MPCAAFNGYAAAAVRMRKMKESRLNAVGIGRKSTICHKKRRELQEKNRQKFCFHLDVDGEMWFNSR